MRLIGTLKDDREASTFSRYLTDQGIENLVETTKITNWASNDYGTLECRVWVYDEDQFEEAMRLLKQFQEDPANSQFQAKEKTLKVNTLPRLPKYKAPINPPKGTLTLLFILACTLLFFGNIVTSPTLKQLPKGIPSIPLLHSPISETLWFDYPAPWTLIDKLVKAYGIEALETPDTLPKEGKFLLQKAKQMPVFEGFYPKIVSYFKDGAPITVDAPLFEKIRQGEYYRLFTPCLLHFDILHLFFNMIWLFVLGAQIEAKLPKWAFLFLIFSSGIFSNVCQYLAGGPNFIGFSGIVCAMIVFIWIRQKKAPWEGYQLLPMTMGFVTVFVLAMVAIQTLSFALEVTGNGTIPLAIANTAHISGAFFGLLFAKGWNRLV